jgi:protein-disulfide isomerase
VPALIAPAVKGIRKMIRAFFYSVAIVLLAVFSVVAQEPREIVAKVDGENISVKDLRDAAGVSLARLEDATYRLKQQALQSLIEDKLLAHEARRRNVPLESLIETEITSKVATVTPQEIDTLYEIYEKRWQKPKAEVEGQLRSLLLEQKIKVRRHEFAQALQANAKVSVYLDSAAPVRAVVGVDGPSRGPASAAVTIVEFEDFQCPFCKGAQDIMEQVLARYKDRVRMVHRDLPLRTLHPASWKAHEAGRCAEEQGKFWEYRALLYKNAPGVSPDQLNNYASQAGLNISDFTKCLDSEKFNAVIQKDEDEANRLGIQGTPFFFINGRLLSGAQPMSEFVRIIEDELNKPPTDRGSKTSEVDKTVHNSGSSQ